VIPVILVAKIAVLTVMREAEGFQAIGFILKRLEMGLLLDGRECRK
jgi:hypothetical protein